MEDSPNEVSDDEELDNTVDDADGPALHYHRLGGFIGEEVCYTRPHPRSMCVFKFDMTYRNRNRIPRNQQLQISVPRCG